MSRDRDAEPRVDSPGRTPVSRPERERTARPPQVPLGCLSLPRTENRERVRVDERVYLLRGSEARTLATVGVFRIVPAEQLDDSRGRDLQHLAAQGLVQRTTITVNHQPMRLVVLTRDGQMLLAATQDRRPDQPDQQYHAGFVKPREAAHDAQLYRLFQAEGARIEASGGRIERVVLDYELKRDYQKYLHRRDRPTEATLETDRCAFAAAYGLSVVDGHLELPDLRIEYETVDGRHESRDVELVTEHYSRGQLAGKAEAGFSRYRAVGAGSSRRGGTPIDPHHLDWVG